MPEKNTIKRVQKWCTEWKKIFSNHVSDKELTSRVYKENTQFNF